jgi:hypothetical protein
MSLVGRRGFREREIMDTSVILNVHSQLGADGWSLLDSDPESRPPNAVGLYQRGGVRAWLTSHDGCRTFNLELEREVGSGTSSS